MALLEKECVALSPQLGPLRILPLHAGLGGLTQRVFESDLEASTQRENDGSEGADSSAPGAGAPSFKRKVIVADILAEASFSLPAIRYVIDTGLQLKTVSSCSPVSLFNYRSVKQNNPVSLFSLITSFFYVFNPGILIIA